jgi:hypothetical protein
MPMLWTVKRRFMRARRILLEASRKLDGSKIEDQKEMQRLIIEYARAKKNFEQELSFSLMAQTDELDLELPPQSDTKIWMTDDVNGEQVVLFTSHGRSVIRKAVDAELARRFEVKTLWVTKFWLPLLAALVGIIGALTGLFAVLQHKK